ncbi:zinc-binding dehydrogenase [Marinomonas fungiae]|uniref:zinc-binding dehydrogenase n=1 Tax=Marinomonas fungiae TaxID=1137284 RepID=UPI003A90D836
MLPNEFSAAVLAEINLPLNIQSSIKVPKLKPGQVLVRVKYAGLCHSQVMEARGKRGEDKFLPHMLGHEGSGEVVEVGEGVTKVSVGDQVVLGWIRGEGMDAGGTVYDSPIGKINAGGVTTFSEYTVVSENRCVRLEEGFPLDLAVLLGCALPTGAGMVLNQLKPKTGSTVAVLGLGGIGLSALLALNKYSLKRVIAIDVSEEKLQLARDFGATDTVLMSPEVAEEVKALLGDGVDYCLEAAGTTQTIETGFALLNRSGHLLFASHPAAGEKISLDPFELICGKSIRGSWGGGTMPDKDVPELMRIIKELDLPVHKLLSHRYTLDEINQALDDLEDRKIVRALIEIDV